MKLSESETKRVQFSEGARLTNSAVHVVLRTFAFAPFAVALEEDSVSFRRHRGALRKVDVRVM